MNRLMRSNLLLSLLHALIRDLDLAQNRIKYVIILSINEPI